MERWTRLKKKYEGFVEDRGFFVIVTICVLVIAVSACVSFSSRSRDSGLIAEPEPNQGVLADEGESLADALATLEPTSLPQPSVKSYERPVEGSVILPFRQNTLVWMQSIDCWQLHLGIDLQCDYGEPVKSIADGRVLSVEKDDWHGYTVRIEHDAQMVSVYRGLAEAPYTVAGDPVYAGQTIGHAGNEILAEKWLGAHLHFEVLFDDDFIDPTNFLLGVVKNNTM